MNTRIIVSYDGTPNDDDALAFGRLLAAGGASLALAYVRHTTEFDPARETVAQHDAERRLQSGADWLGTPDMHRHVVIASSTGVGLAELAQREKAQMIVFGSDYRTSPGRAEPGNSARHLLEHGAVAIAIAPAGLRVRRDGLKGSVASVSEGDPAVSQTAESLATALGAELAGDARAPGVGLVVLGSREGSADGHILLSSASRGLIEDVRAAFLALPRGHALTLS